MLVGIQKLGRFGVDFCARLGCSGLFLLRILLRRPQLQNFMPVFVQQLYFIGVLSLIIIVVSALFIGMVVALQGHHTLSRFAATAQLGELIALSVVRELGPVVTALLFAGRAGSAVTAEIGLMKSTEQLASMEMMAVDPIWRVIYPRLLAGFIALPVLAIIFCAVAIYGGYFASVHWLGVDNGAFWANMQASVNFRLDVLNGIIKSIVFGLVVIWISVYQGYYTVPTAPGISHATTKTVVFSSLAILGLDFVLTAIMLRGW